MKTEKKCMLLLGSFYAMNCVIISYAAYYLGKIGFSDRLIGIIVALACLVGAVFQVVAGRVADKSPKWYWKNQLIIYVAAELLLVTLLLVFRNLVITGIIYGISIMLILLIMPMANTACFYYSSRGVPVNFGVVRGIGSVAFAVASFAVGKMTGDWGSIVVPVSGIVLGVILLFTVISMPQIKSDIITGGDQDVKAHQGSKSFVRKYPVFIVMAIGMILVLVLHNMVNIYLIRIVENVGGNSSSLGIALGIASISEIPVLFLYNKVAGKKEKSAATFIMIACAFFVLRGVLYIISKNIIMVYITQFIQGVSYGLLTVAKASYASQVIDREDETTGQSVMTVTDALSVVSGSFLGGILVDRGGISLMLWVSFVMAAIGAVVAFLAGRKSRS